MPKLPTRKDVEIYSWSERDRTSVEVRDKRTGKTVAEWHDEDAQQMFEDGFFKPGHVQNQTITGRDFTDSVLDYCEEMGMLAKETSPSYTAGKPKKHKKSTPSLGGTR